MERIKYILLFTVLILTISVKSSNAETTCTLNDLGDQTCITTTTTNVPGVTTNNLVSQEFLDGSWTYNNNSNHGTGTIAGVDGQYFETTVSLNNDANLSKEEINSGFSSTTGADVWFWSGNTNQNVILKQTLTDDNGNVTTQQRIINYDTEYFKTHTDTIIVNSNSQQDYEITSRIEVNVPGVTGHGGADIISPTLNVTTNGSTETSTTETFTPCFELNTCTDAGEAINDAVDLKTSDGKDLFLDLDNKVDDAFKEIEKMEEVKIEDVKFDVIVEDDLGNFEEVKFEDFVEMQFTDFIETNNLVEDFKQELKVEGITEEQFFDELGDSMMKELGGDMMNEIASLNEPEIMMEEPKMEEFKDEDTMTGDFEEETIEAKPTEESNIKEESNATNQEPTNEDVKTDETIQANEKTTEPERQESDVVSNESELAEDKETERQEETESNDEVVEDETDVSVENRKITNADTSSIGKKVAKIIAKINSKIKRVDQKLQATSLVLSAGLSSNAPDLTVYKSKRLNGGSISDGNLELFQKLNILEQQQIYKDASLTAYISNDPIAVKQNALARVTTQINSLQAEISALKSLQ